MVPTLLFTSEIADSGLPALRQAMRRALAVVRRYVDGPLLVGRSSL